MVDVSSAIVRYIVDIDAVGQLFTYCQAELSGISGKQIVENVRSGSWDLADFALLFGEAHLKEWETGIKEFAVQARDDRLAGLEPNGGLGVNQAAKIVSYHPDEEVPAKITAHFQRTLAGRDWHVAILGNLLSFPLAALALGDRHGTRLREELWG